MAVFNPQLFSNLPPPPAPAPVDPGMPLEGVPPVPPMADAGPLPVPPVAPPVPAPAPQPVFIPVPIQIKAPEPKPKGAQISPEAARKAQGIYPQEKQAKQQMIDNAKAPPTPTGAWGAPA